MEGMKMCNSCWTELLKSALAKASAAQPDRPQRVAVLGIGNELNGDDAAGVEISRRLIALLPASEYRYIVEAGPAPEAFTGPLRRFQPDLVILVDAGQMDEPPGTIRWFEWQQAAGFSASTHTLPPTVIARFLLSEMHCAVGLLLVQAVSVEFDAPVHPAVQQAVVEAADALVKILR